jgi:hypothetical protein
VSNERVLRSFGMAILGDFACRPSEACVRRTKWQIVVRDYFVNGVDGVV